MLPARVLPPEPMRTSPRCSVPSTAGTLLVLHGRTAAPHADQQVALRAVELPEQFVDPAQGPGTGIHHQRVAKDTGRLPGSQQWLHHRQQRFGVGVTRFENAQFAREPGFPRRSTGSAGGPTADEAMRPRASVRQADWSTAASAATVHREVIAGEGMWPNRNAVHGSICESPCMLPTMTRSGACRCTTICGCSSTSCSKARRRASAGTRCSASARTTAAPSTGSIRWKMAAWDDAKIECLLRDPGIIRNRLKLQAARGNAHCFLALREELGSFSDYLWSFVGGTALAGAPVTVADYRATSPESDALSRDLKRRGFRFAGSTVMYAHMQATGMVNDHSRDCFRRHAGQRRARLTPRLRAPPRARVPRYECRPHPRLWLPLRRRNGSPCRRRAA